VTRAAHWGFGRALDRLERQKAQGGLVVGIDDERDEWADEDDGDEQQEEEQEEEEARVDAGGE
jgi:hypothetical protein